MTDEEEIFAYVSYGEMAEKLNEFSDKVEMLRSEVDTIGNVLLQLIHARNESISRGEE